MHPFFEKQTRLLSSFVSIYRVDLNRKFQSILIGCSESGKAVSQEISGNWDLDQDIISPTGTKNTTLPHWTEIEELTKSMLKNIGLAFGFEREASQHMEWLTIRMGCIECVELSLTDSIKVKLFNDELKTLRRLCNLKGCNYPWT